MNTLLMKCYQIVSAIIMFFKTVLKFCFTFFLFLKFFFKKHFSKPPIQETTSSETSHFGECFWFVFDALKCVSSKTTESGGIHAEWKNRFSKMTKKSSKKRKKQLFLARKTRNFGRKTKTDSHVVAPWWYGTQTFGNNEFSTVKSMFAQ